MSSTIRKPTYLAQKNAHVRDAAIQFEEETHIYTVNGDRTFTSVTTWNHMLIIWI